MAQIDAKMGAKSGPGETMKTVLPFRRELTLALQAGYKNASFWACLESLQIALSPLIDPKDGFSCAAQDAQEQIRVELSLNPPFRKEQPLIYKKIKYL